MQVDVRHRCYDPHRNYYTQPDGDLGGQMDASNEFLTDKWRITFKVYDLNHDRILDSNDLRIQQNIYINLYKLKGEKADQIKEKLSKYWDCITFDGVERGLTMQQFVARRMKAYKNDKAETIKKIKKCLDEFVEVMADQNKDGYISVRELYTVLKGLKKGNRKLAKQQYATICPGVRKCCSVERASDFYTELHFGDNKEKYTVFKNQYEDVGMSLEDIVE